MPASLQPCAPPGVVASIIILYPKGGWVLHGDVLKTLDFKRPLELLTYQLTADPTVAGRIEAAQELAKDGSRAAVEALVAALGTESFWGVRVEIAKALGEVRGETAKVALLDGLSIEHSRVRRAVVKALSAFKGDAAVADAIWRRFEAGDPSCYVEAEAARTIGRLRGPTAFARAVAALERPSWNDVVRMYALTALRNDLDQLQNENRQLRNRVDALEALGGMKASTPGST